MSRSDDEGEQEVRAKMTVDLAEDRPLIIFSACRSSRVLEKC